jgi:hypothetical protein
MPVETKRGLYRQAEPDPMTVELSALIFKIGGGNFARIGQRARDAGFSLADSTIAKCAYCETMKPRNETRDGILAGLGIVTRLVLPDGQVWEFSSREECVREWHRTHEARSRSKGK